MTGDAAVTVRTSEAGDEARVLEVLQAAFGKWPDHIEHVDPTEFFRWKHQASPFGQSTLLVAETEGKVVGFVALMPWPLRARGQLLTTVRGVDLAVDPSHRRRGVSLALIRAVPKHFSVDVAFSWNNPNERSGAGLVKTGRRKVKSLPRFIRPGGPLRATLRRARSSGSRTPERLRIEAPSAAEILRDGARTSRLLAQASEPSDRLATAKDLQYLRWRYGQFEEYRALLADAGGGAGGLAIFRARRLGSFWVLQVCELLVEEDDRRAARRLLARVRRSAAADFLSCGFPSRRQAASCAFVQFPRGTVLTTNPRQANIVPDPTLTSSWALSLGDLELL